HTRFRGNAAGVLGGGVRTAEVLLQPLDLCVGALREQVQVLGRVRLVDHDVGAAGELDHGFAVAGVAGDHDGAVVGVEPVAVRLERGMLDGAGGDGEPVAGEHLPVAGDVPRGEHAPQLRAAQGLPVVDVDPVHGHVLVGDLLHRPGSDRG